MLKLIYKYLTDKNFRSYINYITQVADNENGIADKLNNELDEFKKNTLDRLKKRIDELSSAMDILKQIPSGEKLTSKLNFVLNELKEDYKEISSVD